ncbi:MAG TPA: tRNA (guanosine(37)-N1)-methyltransferase TrmD [Microbacteriaceae bacterium]|nr:tRNA (guanosine(37)-N1)-methyltransferase TrmD [Microbacteriaceae bacterium]
MRIDVVTIFPDYFAPLDVSLIGKARAGGLLDVRLHDLRDFTHDRHHTVDDTPAGGGAGMVMRPEPWGEAFDRLLGEAPPTSTGDVTADRADPGTRAACDAGAGRSGTEPAGPVIVFPSPAGHLFTQRTAHRLAARERLVFGCGRYEGIDQRVYEEAARHAPVELLSLGDYVLNGGEVAVLAMLEAIVRLVPGVVGNPESLVEESHEDGLLEAPVYTKPSTWRGLSVPPVLLSGDHARVDAWRRQQQRERTGRVRPDLLRVTLPASPARECGPSSVAANAANAASGVGQAPPERAVPAARFGRPPQTL